MEKLSTTFEGTTQFTSDLYDSVNTGSFGDLMNQKKFYSSQWSVRSETLIAKTVPLSTVTPRHSPTPSCWGIFPMEDVESNADGGPLTSVQRTNKLSKLIRHQKNFLKWKNQVVCKFLFFMIFWRFFLYKI